MPSRQSSSNSRRGRSSKISSRKRASSSPRRNDDDSTSTDEEEERRQNSKRREMKRSASSRSEKKTKKNRKGRKSRSSRSNSRSSSDSESDIETGQRSSRRRQRLSQNKKKREGSFEYSTSNSTTTTITKKQASEIRERKNEMNKRSSERTINSGHPTTTSNQKGINLRGNVFRLLVRELVAKFDGKPYSKKSGVYYKHMKRRTKGIPFFTFDKRKRRKDVSKVELMNALQSKYEEERYMMFIAVSTDIYFDIPNHLGTKVWRKCIRMVVAENLASSPLRFDKQLFKQIQARLSASSNENGNGGEVSYFVGHPPTSGERASKNDIVERYYKQFDVEKEILQTQLNQGYLQRYRILGNSYWRSLGRKLSMLYQKMTWLHAMSAQCKDAIERIGCISSCSQCCSRGCAKTRTFFRTDPKTGEDVFQKISNKIEITMFGYTSAWPMVTILWIGLACLIGVVIFTILKMMMFYFFSWERCAEFNDVTVCGGSNLGS